MYFKNNRDDFVVQLFKKENCISMCTIVIQWANGAQDDVVLTSMRRHHVASTLIQRHSYVMYPLGPAGSLLLSHMLLTGETILKQRKGRAGARQK